MLYAEVAVRADAPYRHPFTYSVPPGLSLQPGQMVLVPFGPRSLQGIVLSVGPLAAFEGEIRPVTSVAGETPLVLPHLLPLVGWLSDRYLAPLYSCAALMLPPGVERRTRARLTAAPEAIGRSESEQLLLAAVRADPGADSAALLDRLQLAGGRRIAESLIRRGELRRSYVLDAPSAAPRTERRVSLVPGADRSGDTLVCRVREAGGSLPLRAARGLPGWSDAAMRRLVQEGVLEEVEVRVYRDPLADLESAVRPPARLTQPQQAAVRAILDREAGAERRPTTLLHGVTGSGKTEVYLEAAQQTLAGGRRVIVLVPEIALTAQTIERFAGRFPGRVAVLHSGLTLGQRYDQWCAVREGRFDVVIGSRSALFAPVSDLGLMVIDEEHEWTYKQHDPQPRYVTRDVAARIAQLSGAPLVLGSATPDVVSYARAQRGRYRLAELPHRIRPSAERPDDAGVLPEVRVVDLARELREGNRSIFSRGLSEALAATLARGDQAILFLNRRGSSSFVLCRDCGHVPRCRRCDVSLTFHSLPDRLVCHHCGRSRRAPAVCPRCRGGRIRQVGIGTQRVEDEVRRRFPDIHVVRWDRDSARKAADHAALYREAQASGPAVLIGTQMIAKGLDLPGVTLVGIVNADLSLNQHEFCAVERAFELFTQVAGRAGRRERRGLVILQTYAPNHYAVTTAAAHDYTGFYRQEMEFRRRAAYPPFARLTRLVYSSGSSDRGEAEARRVAQHLRRLVVDGIEPSSDVLGPVPCQVARLRGRWRWQVLLRSARPQELLRDLPLPAGWSIDVDPQAFS